MVMNAYADFYNKYIVVFTAKVSSWIEAVKAWFKGESNQTQTTDDNHNDNHDTPNENANDVAQDQTNDQESELQLDLA